MVATDDAVWVAGGGDDGCTSAVYRIDPRTNAVAQTIPMTEETTPRPRRRRPVVRLGAHDAGTDRSRDRDRDRPDDHSRHGVRIGGRRGAVWITDRDAEQLYKIGPS